MEKTSDPPIVGFSSHDHQRCVTSALKEADEYCQLQKLRFTTVRRRTLGILLESHTALGAYDVLGRLKAEGLGSKPPVAYRALAFLLEHGFIHRVERLNAFIACSHPGAKHQPAFLICRDCGSVAEASVNPVSGSLRKTARQNGFQIQHATLEAEGQCPMCHEQHKP